MPQDELTADNDNPTSDPNQTDTQTPSSEGVGSPSEETLAIADDDLDAAKAAWDGAEAAPELSEEEIQRAAELAEPFVGRWNNLISTTNWEKGRIVSEWRQRLIASGVDATQYSDEAWSRRVGGVTSPHVGRLRRVYEKFGDSYDSYEGLYWSHFLAALDWEDGAMWLEGASKENWSISAMREQRWRAEGAVDSMRPTDSQIVDVDTDEDITLPAQGDKDRREYDNDTGGTAAGKTYENADFGDEEELQSLAGQTADAPISVDDAEDKSEAANPTVQPFINLPALPDDLNDAVEMLKLSLLRHKSDEWRDVDVDTVQKYLDAISVMIRN